MLCVGPLSGVKYYDMFSAGAASQHLSLKARRDWPHTYIHTKVDLTLILRNSWEEKELRCI